MQELRRKEAAGITSTSSAVGNLLKFSKTGHKHTFANVVTDAIVGTHRRPGVQGERRGSGRDSGAALGNRGSFRDLLRRKSTLKPGERRSSAKMASILPIMGRGPEKKSEEEILGSSLKEKVMARKWQTISNARKCVVSPGKSVAPRKLPNAGGAANSLAQDLRLAHRPAEEVGQREDNLPTFEEVSSWCFL